MQERSPSVPGRGEAQRHEITMQGRPLLRPSMHVGGRDKRRPCGMRGRYFCICPQCNFILTGYTRDSFTRTIPGVIHLSKREASLLE
jgi:hypothetical protein